MSRQNCCEDLIKEFSYWHFIWELSLGSYLVLTVKTVSGQYSTILYNTMLYYTILHYTTLHYTILDNTILWTYNLIKKNFEGDNIQMCSLFWKVASARPEYKTTQEKTNNGAELLLK